MPNGQSLSMQCRLQLGLNHNRMCAYMLGWLSQWRMHRSGEVRMPFWLRSSWNRRSLHSTLFGRMLGWRMHRARSMWMLHELSFCKWLTKRMRTDLWTFVPQCQVYRAECVRVPQRLCGGQWDATAWMPLWSILCGDWWKMSLSGWRATCERHSIRSGCGKHLYQGKLWEWILRVAVWMPVHRGIWEKREFYLHFGRWNVHRWTDAVQWHRTWTVWLYQWGLCSERNMHMFEWLWNEQEMGEPLSATVLEGVCECPTRYLIEI